MERYKVSEAALMASRLHNSATAETKLPDLSSDGGKKTLTTTSINMTTNKQHKKEPSIQQQKVPPQTVKASNEPLSRNQKMMNELAATSRGLPMKTQGAARMKRNINFSNLLAHPTQPLGVKFEVL